MAYSLGASNCKSLFHEWVDGGVVIRSTETLLLVVLPRTISLKLNPIRVHLVSVDISYPLVYCTSIRRRMDSIKHQIESWGDICFLLTGENTELRSRGIESQQTGEREEKWKPDWCLYLVSMTFDSRRATTGNGERLDGKKEIVSSSNPISTYSGIPSLLDAHPSRERRQSFSFYSW